MDAAAQFANKMMCITLLFCIHDDDMMLVCVEDGLPLKKPGAEGGVQPSSPNLRTKKIKMMKER